MPIDTASYLFCTVGFSIIAEQKNTVNCNYCQLKATTIKARNNDSVFEHKSLPGSLQKMTWRTGSWLG